MRLLRLHAHQFRNLEDVTLSFGRRFNVFFGDNAQGKTNLLEAIFLLGTMKSFRMAKSIELVRWGESAGIVEATVDKEGVNRDITLLLERQGKKVTVDGKPVSRMTDFFGNLNVVVFSPEEMAMVRGTPDMRRRYLDRAVFSSDLTYLRLYHEYGKILKNRNILLKTGDRASLPVWTSQLAETGGRMIRRRVTYLEAIRPLFRQFYEAIAGTGEEADVAYHPHGMDREALHGDVAASLMGALDSHGEEERRRGMTVIGPHRDDLEFLLSGKILKQHASQGQQRTFVLALKMAEIEYLSTTYGVPPVLLLDDMTSELDENRNHNLMDFLRTRDMQVFITTTSLQNIMLDDIHLYPTFRIEAGKVVHERQ